MAGEVVERDELNQELKKMQICRFCLSRNQLSGIFVKPANVSSLAPLSVQVMACASIEIFSNDGMPSLICKECRLLFEHSYRFKQMCKRADTLLRQFPLTGTLPEPLEKPKIPQSLIAFGKKQAFTQPTSSNRGGNGGGGAKKILNAAPTASFEPMRFTFKTESNQDEIHILNNDQDISMEDVQNLLVNDGDQDFVYAQPSSSNNSAPKLLNKASKRQSNIDLDKELEPQFSKPKMQMNPKGHMEIVTAIVQPNNKPDAPADKNSIKAAEPVATDNFPCPFCERSFPLLQLRDIHLTRHNRERNFQCPDCDKSFFSKYDLQKHEVRHTGERPFKCQICDKSFTRSTLLHRHERVHTDIPKFLCMYCEKPFISKDELETHITRHEKSRPFKCQECGKAFAFKQGLERHEVVHSAVLPYPCQYCDQSFTTPSKLSRHLNAHAGDRPFPCKYCNKSYLLSHHLTRHLRSHKQEKDSEYHCTDCKKNFKTRDDLIYHTAVHSTANLICTLCQTTFEAANEVTAHIKLHIEGETYACEFCDLLFLTSEELLTHYEKHSTEVEEFKYNTNVVSPPAKKKKTQPILNDEDESFDKNSKQQLQQQHQSEQVTVLDGDDENVVATINDIFSLDDLVVYDTAVSNANDKNGNNKKEFTIINQEKSPEKPQILNQIVISSKNSQNMFEFPTNDNNDGPPSAKTRKVIARGGKLQIVNQLDSKTITQNRNLAEKPLEIKIEKESPVVEKSIKTTALPVLPKGVTLRKTSVANSNSTTATATPSEQKPNQTKKMTLAEAQAVVTEKRAREAEELDEKPATRARRSGGDTIESNKATTSAATKSTKVKQIRMTKAQADELAKQGRIKFKDGNMILTKSNK